MIFIKYHKQTSYVIKSISCLLGYVAVMSSLDVFSDIKNKVAWAHVLVELSIVFCSLLSAILLMHWFYKVSQTTLNEVKTKLIETDKEARFWREENKHIVRGLSANIYEQFNIWHLTPTECEIGFLLLKGYSLQEIAEFKSKSERTVREQAGNIYHKANLTGRSELTAFFLEDLLSPHE